MCNWCVLFCLLIAGSLSLAQDLPEFTQVAAFWRKQRQESPLVVVVERLPFNGFLTKLPRPCIVEAKLKLDLVAQLANLAKKREEVLKRNVDEAQIKWQQLSMEERAKELLRIEEEDEHSITEMTESLDELLSPGQKKILAKNFMTNHGEYCCSDPLLRHWVGLTQAQAKQIGTRYELASKFIVGKWQERNLPFASQLPEEEDAEYRRLMVLAWEGIDSDTLRNILIYSGLLLEEEELANYVDRAPRFRESLVKYVPAFADSVRKRDGTNP